VPRKDASDVSVALKLLHNGQEADGSGQITAAATVTVDGTPRSGVTVYFELLGSQSARFQNGTTRYTAPTQGSGGTTSPIPFTDTIAEVGRVVAFVEVPDGDDPTATKPFIFFPIKPDALDLDLIGDGAPADKFHVITAKATVKKNGQPLQGVEVFFDLVPSRMSAVFSDAPAKAVKITSPGTDRMLDRNGYFVAGTGAPGTTVTISQTGGQGQPQQLPVGADATFRCNAPYLAMFNGNSDDTAPMCNGLMHAAWNSVSAQSTAPPRTLAGRQQSDSLGKLTSGISGPDGVVEMLFQDVVVENGLVEAWIPLNDGDEVSAQKKFQFTPATPGYGTSDQVKFPVCPVIPGARK
jgi:hypothetical protein